jgi:hypothetical protein
MLPTPDLTVARFLPLGASKRHFEQSKTGVTVTFV